MCTRFIFLKRGGGTVPYGRQSKTPKRKLRPAGEVYICPVEPRKKPTFGYRLLSAVYPAFRMVFPNLVKALSKRDDRLLECQPIGAGGGRSLAAIWTRSARESALIFRITWPRCAFTVISLIPSSLPTCLFNRPETTNAMTSRSRSVSDA